MRLLLTIAVTLGLVGSASAAKNIQCPKGTEARAEEMPEVHEAWCEKMHEGKAVMHGPYRAWWPNGRLGTSGQYQNGKPVGRWSGWYPTGKKQGYEWFEAGKVIKGEYFDRDGNPTAARPNSTAETDARKSGARGSP